MAPRTRGSRGPHAAFLLTRWRKFWGAPVTVFLGNVLMYFAFLFLFSYVLLVDFRPPPQGPSGPEVTLYFWVFTLVLEEIRQVGGGPAPQDGAPSGRPRGRGLRHRAVRPPPGLLHGRGHAPGEEGHAVRGGQLEQVRHGGHLPLHRGRHLQVRGARRPGGGGPGGPAGRAAAACIPAGPPGRPAWPGRRAARAPRRVLPSGFEAGRTILAVDFMVFALRLIHIFAIHKQLGPKIIIVERMVRPPGGGRPRAPPGGC